MRVVQENREAIESLKRAMHDRVQLTILISLPYTPTPEAYHDLFSKLMFVGVFFCLGCILTSITGDERNR